MTITEVTIKNPDRKGIGDVNEVMPGSNGQRIWGFEKKTVTWDSTLGEERRFLIWARPDKFGSTVCPRVCWVSESRADDVRTVSIVWNCVSLSSCRKTLNSIREIKVNQESRQCFEFFRIPICVWTFYEHCERFTYLYILCTFHVFVDYG